MNSNPSDFKSKDLKISDINQQEVGALANIVENQAAPPSEIDPFSLAQTAVLKVAAPVPDNFRELHPDLKSLSQNLVLTFSSAILFCIAITLAMLLPGNLALKNYQSMGINLTGFVLLLLASFGLLYLQRVREKACLHASWVFKTVNPIDVDALVSTYELNSDTPCYKRVFTFRGEYAQEVETYLEIEKSGKHLSTLGYAIDPPRPVKLKVYFDPRCRAAIAAEDWHGVRYWLQPKGNK